MKAGLTVEQARACLAALVGMGRGNDRLLVQRVCDGITYAEPVLMITEPANTFEKSLVWVIVGEEGYA